MMTDKGYTVIHYGVEGSNPTCTENVVTLSTKDHRHFFGKHDYRKSYYPIVWDSTLPYWLVSNANAVREVGKRAEKGDLVCILGGWANKPITDGLGKGILTVEYGIGYHGVYSDYRVYESYAHQAQLYGRASTDPDGRFFDSVIPNYFDLDDFTFNAKPDDYFLLVARMIDRKGLDIAIEATRRAGKRLLLVGQGAKQHASKIITDHATYDAPHAEYVGYADVVRRNDLMRGATALICPTKYLEPFGGVAVEAQLCGTPVISTDWGAFPETVPHGQSGYRCRTLEQFTWACGNVATLDRRAIADRARALYSLERVGGMYAEYFDMLATLSDKGWYAERPDRKQLDWLNAYTPRKQKTPSRIAPAEG